MEAKKEVAELYADACVALGKSHTLKLVGINQKGFVTAEQFKVFGRDLGKGKIEVVIPSAAEVNDKGDVKRLTLTLGIEDIMEELLPLIRAKAKANHKVLGIKIDDTAEGGKKSGKGAVEIA
jgi:hypothetical protein